MQTRLTTLVLVLLSMLPGCRSLETPDPLADPEEEVAAQDLSGEEPIEVFAIPAPEAGTVFSNTDKALQEGINDFGFKMLSSLYDGHSSVVFSPLSLQLALSMLSNGASGETLSEILSVLGAGDASLEELNAMSESLLRFLSSARSRDNVEMRSSDLVVVNNRFSLKEDFRETVARRFFSPAVSLDFSDEQHALDLINDWSSRNTDGIIPQLLGGIPESCVLMLLNALYVNAPWTRSFDIAQTEEDDFTQTAGTQVRVRMMHNEYLPSAAFGEGKDCAAARLSLGSIGGSSLFIFLPSDGKKPKDLLDALAGGAWPAYKKMLAPVDELDLYLPRFSVTSAGALEDALKQLGIRRAFSPSAELQGLTGMQVPVSEVLQKARIDVDEKGVVAAAVTAVSMGPTEDDPEEIRKAQLRVDHSFVFVLTEGMTGAVLFAGVWEGE